MLSGQQAAATYIPNKLAKAPVDVRKNLSAVNRDVANIEAEGGETVFIPNKDGGPAHYNIKGPRHFEGGVPLAIPPQSFVFSDTRSMKIKDPALLAEFGMPEKKGGYTPAEIAKKYDINTYRKVLADPNSDALQVASAEKMIANYQVKLGKLALIQESIKSFPGGIPAVAMPYLNKYQLDPSLFLPTDPSQTAEQPMNPEMMQSQEMMPEMGMPEEMPMARTGGEMGLKKFAPGGQTGEQDINPRVARRLERRARRQAERDYYNQVLQQILQEVAQEPTQQQINLANRPDPSTGVFLRRNADGTIYYEDGNGVRIESFDKNYNTTTTTTGTEPELKDGEKIVVKNGKKYIVKSITKPAVEDKSKIKPKAEATQAGDIYEENGKYYKVKSYDVTKPIASTKSGKTNYTGNLDQDKVRAEEILNKLEKAGVAEYHDKNWGDNNKYGPGWHIKPGAREKMTTGEKDFLTKFLSYGAESNVLGVPGEAKYQVALQSGQEGFYGYTDPNFYEYRFWQARNPGKAAEDWDALSGDEKVKNRKNMFYSLGIDIEDPHIKANIADPKKLYTNDFVTGNKRAKTSREIKDVNGNIVKDLNYVDAVENFFNPSSFRPGLGDDRKLGLEHADAFTFEKGIEELTDQQSTEERLLEDRRYKSPEYTRGEEYTPFWLQDKIRNVSAAINWANINRYNPALLQYDPYVARPTVYSPEQEIAANQAAARGAADVFRGISGSTQAAGARISQTQGDLANIIAKTMGTYNNQNVGVANEFAYKTSDTINQARLKNLQGLSTYVDQVNTLNQNYDNAKAQAREEWTQALSDAYTNRSKTQVLNTLYPQYHIDPASGGDMDFVKGRDMLANENALYAAQDAELFAKFMDEHPNLDAKVAALIWTKGKSGAGISPEAAYFDAYSNSAPQDVQQMPAGNNPNYYVSKKGGQLPFDYVVGVF